MHAEPLRMQAQELREINREMHERIRVLHHEAAQSQLSIPEQRDALLNKVKQDNNEIVQWEKETEELKLDLEKYKKLLSEMKTDIEEKKGI